MRLINESLSAADKAEDDVLETRWNVSLDHHRALLTSDANPMKEVVGILGVEAHWRKYTFCVVYKNHGPYESVPALHLFPYK